MDNDRDEMLQILDTQSSRSFLLLPQEKDAYFDMLLSWDREFSEIRSVLSTNPIRAKDPKEQTFVSKSSTRRRKIILLRCYYCRDCDTSAKEGVVEMVRENRANGRKIEKLRQRYVGRKKRVGHN